MRASAIIGIIILTVVLTLLSVGLMHTMISLRKSQAELAQVQKNLNEARINIASLRELVILQSLMEKSQNTNGDNSRKDNKLRVVY